MKTYMIEIRKEGAVIYRNYINSYTVETAILAAAAVVMKHNLTRVMTVVSDGHMSYENDY